MPAERSRGSRRTGADGTQLVWTMPVEHTLQGQVSFAPNLTPITFNEPGPDGLSSAPIPESNLFPFVDESSSSSTTCSGRRPAHSKKKPENHIPRPPNAFILFRSSFIKSQHVSTGVETNHSTLSKIIGLTWQNLPEEEKMVWHAKARVKLDEHKRKFPEYTFRPLHSKAKNEKRKVREVGRKDLKRCAKIAELLVEGKKGEELDMAIQEFDKTHVPEIVTRFEAPITEKSFRKQEEETEESESEEGEDQVESASASASPPPLSSYASSRESSRCPSPVKYDRYQSSPPPQQQQQPALVEAPTLPDIESLYSFNSPTESDFTYAPFPLDFNSPNHSTGFEPTTTAHTGIGIDEEEDTAPTRRPSLTINTSFDTNSHPFIDPNQHQHQHHHSGYPSPQPPSFLPTELPHTPCYSDSAFPEYPPPHHHHSALYAMYNPYLNTSISTSSPCSSLPDLSHSLPSSGSSSYEDLSDIFNPQPHHNDIHGHAHGSVPMTPVSPPPTSSLSSPVPSTDEWVQFDLSCHQQQGYDQCKPEPSCYFLDNTTTTTAGGYANLGQEEFDLETLMAREMLGFQSGYVA
ncbi:hypothetical protein K435DRAFT_197172 [Dendrothele bispora CBS 962.96]|uniref:HMG box domain-containing protein n=1 Tax=Dendrothele bispora (strain CBS 962.96) TaxID=1314807 RepID=A0A4S8LVR0_DENBC|nr:hypothetical protein K435DRAFT_197172 [Dendrothele bispora CBS 962.96]